MSLMHTTAFAQFSGTLPSAPALDRHLQRDATGRVQGQFFHYALINLFEPVWQLAVDGALAPTDHEALVRIWMRDGDLGLNPWKVFSLASDDSTLIELDRLYQPAHTLNYLLRTDARWLVVNVHGRLLATMAADHGKTFHRTVTVLGLYPEQFVIQVPSAANDDLGLLLFVVDNYRRNGLVMTVRASNPTEAGALLVYARPVYPKLDARRGWRTRNVVSLVDSVRELDVTLVLQRCERPSDLELTRAAGITYTQGSILPGAELEPEPAPVPQVVLVAQVPLVQQQRSATDLSLTQ